MALCCALLGLVFYLAWSKANNILKIVPRLAIVLQMETAIKTIDVACSCRRGSFPVAETKRVFVRAYLQEPQLPAWEQFEDAVCHARCRTVSWRAQWAVCRHAGEAVRSRQTRRHNSVSLWPSLAVTWKKSRGVLGPLAIPRLDGVYWREWLLRTNGKGAAHQHGERQWGNRKRGRLPSSAGATYP